MIIKEIDNFEGKYIKASVSLCEGKKGFAKLSLYKKNEDNSCHLEVEEKFESKEEAMELLNIFKNIEQEFCGELKAKEHYENYSSVKEKYNKKEELQEGAINEVKLSWAGKLFFAGASAYIAGDLMKTLTGKNNKFKMPIKVKGTKRQLQAIVDAIHSSKAFQKEISKPGASLEKVMKKLKLVNLNKKQFEKVTGKRWPL